MFVCFVELCAKAERERQNPSRDPCVLPCVPFFWFLFFYQNQRGRLLCRNAKLQAKRPIIILLCGNRVVLSFLSSGQTKVGGVEIQEVAATAAARPDQTMSERRASSMEEEDVAVLRMPKTRHGDPPDGDVGGDAVVAAEELTLPVLKDAYGNRFVDVTTLQSVAGICTFDPGYSSTASCESSITYIDGKEGVLLYRGYRIEELAAHGDFYDSSYLLLHGELPDTQEKNMFVKEITYHTLVNEKFIEFFKGFRHDAHPMAIMCGCVGAMSAFYPEMAQVRNPEQQIRACHRLIAKMPTLAAMSYKIHLGQPIIYPRNDLSFVENFLHMMFSLPTEKYIVDPTKARALEVLLILHLDHEQNASTSTVRTAGSSQANPFACVASGIAALWGPAHGGANEAVIKMLEEINAMGGTEGIPKIIERAKDKSDPFRLMGFGHRLYKTHDPRASVMREITEDLLKMLDRQDPLLDIAIELEKIALKDEYFLKRNLYPNVDFYSGIVLRALEIPVEMYTVLFAMARTVGWVSQWKEMVSEPATKISRPRQIYTGHKERAFRALGSRPPSGKLQLPDEVDDLAKCSMPKPQVMSRLLSTHPRSAMR